MKKITYFIIALSLIINSASALEKKDCSELKKLSKAFINCKQNNIKAAIINTGSSIKKGTVGKIKKEKKISNEDKTSKIKSSSGGLFKGTTKQYPKGVKK